MYKLKPGSIIALSDDKLVIENGKRTLQAKGDVMHVIDSLRRNRRLEDSGSKRTDAILERLYELNWLEKDTDKPNTISSKIFLPKGAELTLFRSLIENSVSTLDNHNLRIESEENFDPVPKRDLESNAREVTIFINPSSIHALRQRLRLLLLLPPHPKQNSQHFVLHFSGDQILCSPSFGPRSEICPDCFYHRLIANHANPENKAALLGENKLAASFVKPKPEQELRIFQYTFETILRASNGEQEKLSSAQLLDSEGTRSSHQIVPVGNCSQCRSKQLSDLGPEELSTENTVQLLESYSDPIGGIIPVCREIYPEDQSRLYFQHAVFSSPLGSFGKGNQHRHVCGVGLNREEARLKAMMEAVERYSAASSLRERAFRASFSEVQDEAIDPREFILYSQEQCKEPELPFSHFEENSAIDWLEAQNLTTAETTLVPLELVTYSSKSSEALIQNTSNGFAAHTNKDDAILGGILERLEREAIFTTWYNKLKPKKVSRDSLPHWLQNEVEELSKKQIAVRFLYLDTDISAHVLLCIFEDCSDAWPALTIGASAHYSAKQSCKKAFQEAYVQWLGAKNEPRPSSELDFSHFLHHRYFFASPNKKQLWSFLLENRTEIQLDQLDRLANNSRSYLELLYQEFKELDVQALAVETTPKEFAGTPIKVFNTLLTKVQPLHFGPNKRLRVSERLLQIPVNLGLRQQQARISELNEVPHPLS